MTKSGHALEDLVGALRPHEGARPAVRDLDVPADGRFQLARAAMDTRRSCFSVRAANQRSTRLIQDALVGVKCTWKRGWRVSQR